MEPNIPHDLYDRIHKFFSNCDEFSNNDRLRAVFAHPRLRPWQKRLRDARSIAARVDFTYDYLVDEYNIHGENALVMLLEVLADRHSHTMRGKHACEFAVELRGYQPSDPIPSIDPELQFGEPAQATMSYEYIRRAELSHAVARIALIKYVNGESKSPEPGTGSAWLVTPQLAFTCWHVLQMRRFIEGRPETGDLDKQIDEAVLTFNYILPLQGESYEVELACYDESLDYAVLRMNGTRVNSSQWGALPIDRAPVLKSHTKLWLIHHPRNKPQQHTADVPFGGYVSGSRNQFILLDATDYTAGGSSGAPVLNIDTGKAVAMHMGTDKTRKPQAVLLSAILDHMAEYNPKICREVMEYQQRS